jgi:hypothetical protein
LLVTGLVAFAFAGQLVARETDPLISAVEDFRTDVSKTLTAYDKQLEELVKQFKEKQKDLNKGKQSPADQQTINSQGVAIADALALFDKLHPANTLAQDKVNALSDELRAAANQGSAPNRVMAAAIVARIGLVVLLVFVVQMLMNAYRYNLNAAAFFDARSDAFELIDEDRDKQADVAKLVELLSAEHVPRGKDPETLIKHAFELAKEALRLGAKGKS